MSATRVIPFVLSVVLMLPSSAHAAHYVIVPVEKDDDSLSLMSDANDSSVTLYGSYEVQWEPPVAPAASGGGVAGGVTSYSDGTVQSAALGKKCSVDTRKAVRSAVCHPVLLPPAHAAQMAVGRPEVVTMRDVATLGVAGSGLTRQPEREEVLLQFDLIVYTDPSPRVLTTTVAGAGVEVEVTPIRYLWDWGDGTTLVTSDPGAAYPNQTVTHRYAQTATGVMTTLTTTWSARFRPSGSTEWQEIAGSLTTQDVSTTYDVVRTVTYLTDDAEEAQGH